MRGQAVAKRECASDFIKERTDSPKVGQHPATARHANLTENALRADVAHRKRGSITLPRLADFHVSLCQVERALLLARSGERAHPRF
jgi:hypothetical protein